MAGEASFLLEMKDKGSDFVVADLGNTGTCTAGNDKVSKVTYAVGHDGNGIWPFSFGSGAELITLKQSCYISARF